VKTGPVDLGPYTVFYGNTDIEGQRFGFGSRTNIDFSNKLTLGGYVAYGTRDERFKYRAYADFILNREKWSNITFDHQKEIDQVWLLNDNVDQGSIFYTFSRFGNMTDPFLYEKNRISLFKQVSRGLSYRLELKNQSYEPQFDFSFTPDRDNPSETYTNMNVSEVTLETRFARDEIFVINDNQRVSLGTVKWPAITFSYSYGIPDLLGSNLEYHRLKMKIEKKQKLGPIGVGYFNLNGGYIFGKVPYPLLFNTIGNETFVYVNFAYNMMNFFEFSSDKYLAFNYRHSFEGFVLNRIPLIRKLKLRLVGILNIVYGSMGNTNLNLVNYPTNDNGDVEYPFFTLENKPYIEVGYGVENIFKFFRVNFFHRLNYLDHPDVNKFGIKINFQFIL
jgi:hypothetical protein